MSDQIKCARCGQKRPPLGFAPLPTELGQKIATEVCQPCWAEWLQAQTRIINHYGLNLADREHRAILRQQMEEFFFGEGAQLAEDWTPETVVQRK